MQMTQKLKKTIADNVKRLIDHEYKDAEKRPSQTKIGEKIGISQRWVSYLFDENSTVESIRSDTIETIASYYGLEPYHLMIPNLPIEELTNKRIEKVIECYSQSTQDGRENIARIAENEVRYSAIDATAENNLEKRINKC